MNGVRGNVGRGGYDVRMYLRASEELKKHNETTRSLTAEAEKKRDDFYALVPGGEEGFKRGVIVRGSIADLAAYEAAEAAWNAPEDAKDRHLANLPDPVRKYRVTSVDGKEIYAEFTEDHVRAKVVAGKIMAEKQISQYGLDEQIGDGSWVPFELPRSSSGATS